jgi:hypothetical protein
LTVRFRKIDDQNRGHHSYLTADDECLFLLEYTSGQDYSFSATNSLISNLKKKPSLAGTGQYRYKLETIHACGVALGEAITPKWLAVGTLVPVPPSKVRGDPEYDDRILKICQAIPAARAVDIREIVIQTRSLPAAHESGQRPTIDDLLAVYRIDESKAAPAPKSIAIVRRRAHERDPFPRDENNPGAVLPGGADLRLLYCPPRVSEPLRGIAAFLMAAPFNDRCETARPELG